MSIINECFQDTELRKFMISKVATVMQVICKCLHATKSVTDQGALYRLLHRCNVGENPKKDFNAHKDFFLLVVQCHIMSASMEVLGMSNLDDTPNEEIIPADVHSMSKDEKVELLTSVVGVILDKCVDLGHSKVKEENQQRTVSKCHRQLQQKFYFIQSKPLCKRTSNTGSTVQEVC